MQAYNNATLDAKVVKQIVLWHAIRWLVAFNDAFIVRESAVIVVPILRNHDPARAAVDLLRVQAAQEAARPPLRAQAPQQAVLPPERHQGVIQNLDRCS